MNTKNVQQFLVLASVVSTLLAGCGSGDSKSSLVQGAGNSGGKKYLASNIVLGDGDLDPTTKVSASNVILDTSMLGIQAGNVQSAFEEVTPDIHQIIVGTWNISDLSQDNSGPSHFPIQQTLDGIHYPVASGQITFNEDGTVIAHGIRQESFLGFLTISDGSIENGTVANYSSTYEIVDDDIIVISVGYQRPSPYDCNGASTSDFSSTCYINTANKSGFPIIRLSPNRIMTDRLILKRQS